MCHDHDAAPPAPAPAVRAVTTEGPVELRSEDGTAVAAYLAEPDRATGPAVLVLPDNRGLSDFYRQVAVRLAEQGHPALALDYFGRTTGDDPALRDPLRRGPEFAGPGLPEHLLALTPQGLDADITAAVHRLRASGARQVVSLGFCFGGRQAFRTTAPRFGLAGAIGFYGHPDRLNGSPGPTQLAAAPAAPLLALWGGADEGIPAATVAGFAAALDAAGCPYEFVDYPGAPHGFFEQAADGHGAAADDAWRRVLAFLAAPGAPTGG